MESTVVQTEKVQTSPPAGLGKIGVFRWQKYLDGDGKLWIVALTWGFDKGGRWGANVELLNVDDEMTIEVNRVEFEGWIRTGTLKRVDTPILF